MKEKSYFEASQELEQFKESLKEIIKDGFTSDHRIDIGWMKLLREKFLKVYLEAEREFYTGEKDA